MGTRRIRRKDGEFTLFFRKVSPFSNHHPAEFLSDGAINRNELLKFSCTEQFYMFNKASLLGNEKLMKDVLEASNPRAMKSMCSKGAIPGWSDPLWDKHKEHVMYVACSAKFRSWCHLRYALFLSTGSRLIECSPFDSIWGIGKDIETAMKTSVNSGRNLLGNILDKVREELWADPSFQDEREEVEKRVEKDDDYLLNAMKHIDLIYKERARQRWMMAKRGFLPNEDYLTPEARQLIPEWAWPPPLGDVESIQPSPPQIINFDRLDSPVRTHSASPLRIPQKSKLFGRLTVSEMRPPLKRRTRSSSRSTFRSRSRSPIRKRRRMRTRSTTFSRSRSRSSSRESRRRERKKSRRSKSRSSKRSSSRKRDKERKKRRHRSRSTSSTERKEKKSRRSEDRKHRKKRSRHRHHHKKHKHRTESSERRRERRRQRRSESKETRKRRRQRSPSTSSSRSTSKEPVGSGDVLDVL